MGVRKLPVTRRKRLAGVAGQKCPVLLLQKIFTVLYPEEAK
jgi:hypothetical protein